MRSLADTKGGWVRAGAAWASGCGVLWLLDANERDSRAHETLDVSEAFLQQKDLRQVDTGSVILELDEHLATGQQGLMLSVLLARVTNDRIVFSFVGETRIHIMNEIGTVITTSREHNAFSSYPSEALRRLGYSEDEAKRTILRAAGSGKAVVETHVQRASPHGRVIGLSHLWHRYRSPDEYSSVLAADISQLAVSNEGEAITVLEW